MDGIHSLEGKVVAVTGGGSGIGYATAFVAARRGAVVVVGDLDDASLTAVAAEASRHNLQIATHGLDVTKPGSVQGFVDAVMEQCGRIDGFVCSAGTTRPTPVLELELDTWEHVIAVNLTGTFQTIQAAARAMVAGGIAGSIVAVSSALAFTGQRLGAHYAASKAGVVGLVKTFALELGGHRIRVNTLAPGATDTPLLRRAVSSEYLEQWAARAPLGRLGLPDDQARCICYLLSDESIWVTGQTFHVNGGSIMP